MTPSRSATTTDPSDAERVIRETISRVIAGVNTLSDSGPGWTRPSYSDLESKAHALIEKEALALGLEVSRDAAGNLFARLAGQDRTAPALFTGSHLDTVSQGGAYDGQAGVAGAMALIAAFRAGNVLPPMDIVLTVTRAEESVWFPVSYIGSRAYLGKLTAEELDAKRVDTGQSLAAHMCSQGYDPEAVIATKAPDPAQFLEFHIEQGPVLHAAGEAYGLVTAIRGGLRYRSARITGQWAHSGGTPRADRADAVVAFSDLVLAMDRIWGEMQEAGDDLTVTFGRVDAATSAHAMAKVAGELEFCVDLRSTDLSVLERADSHLKTEIARIESERSGIAFSLGAQSRSRPATLSRPMAERIARGAARFGEAPRRMSSGGGHDAAAFAVAGWDSVMVFVRNWNGSHCPEEGMNEADLVRAVMAVHAALGNDWQP
ncbi:hydantoinase/carbamoylase family amidase [Roseovarius pelagicus]|uniref:Hydantoinase/carbamoylase family amidase n=1 Tax=Roseovarius pelagicus TaxID=2980108 RepID=A0ABY6D9Z1_9RHOB|nr:hydantoinase/carbamoylase family amidase [Roseovarius pelagicus]UXX82789.1 hydantoinase/carbamoylase family amidase [Roseovarius pelagicus]